MIVWVWGYGDCRPHFTAKLSSPPRLHVPSHRAHINSYMTKTNPSHGNLLADRLRRLDICPKLELGDQLTMTVMDPPISRKPPYEGYGYIRTVRSVL
jgi:hypothetical protein